MTENLNLLAAGVLIDALVASGVRRMSACPGSRSAPLVIAADRNPAMRVEMHLDERSAAFYALGNAKATGSPAAVLCTSGTAAANFFPALIEASLSAVPLVLLTADRPPELRQSGSPQTIDQVHLYGRHALFFQDLPLPEADLTLLRRIAAIAAHACAVAVGCPKGPVHLNVPFREPLAPVAMEEDGVRSLEEALGKSLAAGRFAIEIHRPDPPRPREEALDDVARRLAAARRPLIVAGPRAAPDAPAAESLIRLADRAAVPVLADVASGLRFAPSRSPIVIGQADLFLRAESFRSLAPDFVLRLGDLPTSRTIQDYLALHRPELMIVQPDLRRRDPEALASGLLLAEPGDFCRALERRIMPGGDGKGPDGERASGVRAGHEKAGGGRAGGERAGGEKAGSDRADWLALISLAERAAREMVAEAEAPLEATAVRDAVAAAPAGSSLFLGNSMPIRWAETYCPASKIAIDVHVSRGANGIDGVTSTALGVAAAVDRPLLLVTGDLAFLHDLGGLHAARHVRAPVVIFVLNNDGGGIFSHLPIAAHRDLCERLFHAPHGHSMEGAAALHGLSYARAQGRGEAAEAVARGLRGAGTRIVELRTDAAASAIEHRETMERIAREIARRLAARAEGSAAGSGAAEGS